MSDKLGATPACKRDFEAQSLTIRGWGPQKPLTHTILTRREAPPTKFYTEALKAGFQFFEALGRPSPNDVKSLLVTACPEARQTNSGQPFPRFQFWTVIFIVAVWGPILTAYC